MNNTSTDKSSAISRIAAIHQVEGFDPSALAVEYTDLNSGESRMRLPVMAQMAWFRLVYPEGKISVTATAVKDYYVGHARVYPHYNDPTDSFLAEATASRRYDPEKPTVSPREWAQTAAVGVALRNAGFGLQFHTAGDAFEQQAVDELGSQLDHDMSAAAPLQTRTKQESGAQTPMETEPEYPTEPEEPAPPEETPLEKAMKLPCPITKDGLKGRTLGELIQLDPGALTWIATKYTKNPEIAEGAKLICEHAMAV